MTTVSKFNRVTRVYRPQGTIKVPKHVWEWVGCCLAHVTNSQISMPLGDNDRSLINAEDLIAADFCWDPEHSELRVRFSELSRGQNNRTPVMCVQGDPPAVLADALSWLQSYRFCKRAKEVCASVAIRQPPATSESTSLRGRNAKPIETKV